jgi:hypothetical protein
MWPAVARKTISSAVNSAIAASGMSRLSAASLARKS